MALPPRRNNNNNNRPRPKSRGGYRPNPGGFRPAAPPVEEETGGKEEAIELEGVVAQVLAGTMFRVKLHNESEHIVLAHISGKMRKRFIRLVVGDRVKLEMSPYDTSKARITYRLK